MDVLPVIKPSPEACQECNPSLPVLLPMGVLEAQQGYPGLASPRGMGDRGVLGDPPLPGPLGAPSGSICQPDADPDVGAPVSARWHQQRGGVSRSLPAQRRLRIAISWASRDMGTPAAVRPAEGTR